jgi:hypothetical protein
MAITATAAAIIGATAAVAGTYMSYKAQKKSAAAQQRAAQQAQKAQDLRSARERRTQYRQARAARAQALAAQTGSAGGRSSSSFVTGRGSIGTQAGSNVSFLNQYSDITKQQGIFQTAAYTAQGQANMWGQVAGLGMSVLNLTGTDSLFGKTPGTTG